MVETAGFPVTENYTLVADSSSVKLKNMSSLESYSHKDTNLLGFLKTLLDYDDVVKFGKEICYQEPKYFYESRMNPKEIERLSIPVIYKGVTFLQQLSSRY